MADSVINTYVYACNGRRVSACVRMCKNVQIDADMDFIFCEAALGAALERVYAENTCESMCDARLSLYTNVMRIESRATGLSINRADSPAVVRGIYALACQTKPCFVRGTRNIWNSLMNEWKQNGMSAYFIMRGERVQGYVLFGDKDQNGKYRTVYEFASMPGSGVDLTAALENACRMGLCGEEVLIKGSSMEVSELKRQ